MPVVSVSKCVGNMSAVKEAVNLLGGIGRFVKANQKVLIKPNFVGPNPPPATTSLSVLNAVIELVKEANPSVISIGDSCAWPGKHQFGLGNYENRDVLNQLGVSNLAKDCGVNLIDFDKEGYEEVSIPEGLILKKARICRAVVSSDVLINVPVLKMHYETLVTLGSKNLHGILDDADKMRFHRNDLHQKLVDLSKVVRPDLTIIDGTEAMEGCGPVLGSPVEMDLILASGDMIAADSVGAAIMDIDPDEVETIRLARTQGIGCGTLEEIEIRGLPISRVKKTLKRPNVEISGTYPEINVYKGGLCHFCAVRSWLFLKLLKDKDLLKESGIKNIFVGKSMRIPELGDCSISSLRPLIQVLGRDAICLYGCPPIESTLRAVDGLKMNSGKGGRSSEA
jgi:uncharacterized protein (DUF362 family)